MNERLSIGIVMTLTALLVGCGTLGPRTEEAAQVAVEAAAEEGPGATSRPPTETNAVVPTTVTPELTDTAPSATPLVVRTTADVQRITPNEAKALLDGGQAVLYDARSPESYSEQHAAAAISFPEEEVDARFGELPTDKVLIFYCT